MQNVEIIIKPSHTMRRSIDIHVPIINYLCKTTYTICKTSWWASDTKAEPSCTYRNITYKVQGPSAAGRADYLGAHCPTEINDY